ncbi:hypothetical protein EYB25_010040 [Talaromyces marneffei]|nr:hypothetical protein EYB25_010040 [Talaromyces marneffei]
MKSHPTQSTGFRSYAIRIILGCCACGEKYTMASATTFYDFSPPDKKGNPYPLTDYKGKVVLVVNTASKCGFTPQFAGLEKLYKSIEAKHPGAFTILGFPCNQFGNQDPGGNDEIQSFCQVNYGVTFPVLGKIDVNGSKAEPLFEWIKSEKPGLLGVKRVLWNFEKALINGKGEVVGRWRSITKPESLEATILKEIDIASKDVKGVEVVPTATETAASAAPAEEAKEA